MTSVADSELMNEQAGVEERDEGADCFSTDGLVARAHWPGVRTQMRTAQRVLHSNPVDIDDSSHPGLVELARCRSDLSLASSG